MLTRSVVLCARSFSRFRSLFFFSTERGDRGGTLLSLFRTYTVSPSPPLHTRLLLSFGRRLRNSGDRTNERTNNPPPLVFSLVRRRRRRLMCLPSFPPLLSLGAVRFTPRVASTSFRESYSSTHPEAGRPSKNRKNYSSKSKQTEEEEEGKPVLTREKRRGENKVFFRKLLPRERASSPPVPLSPPPPPPPRAHPTCLRKKRAVSHTHSLPSPPLPRELFGRPLSPLSLPTELQCLDR